MMASRLGLIRRHTTCAACKNDHNAHHIRSASLRFALQGRAGTFYHFRVLIVHVVLDPANCFPRLVLPGPEASALSSS
jgi:hypothetical protein